MAIVPATRWNAAERPSGLDTSVTDRTRHGAFIFGAVAFDNGRFAISPAEASAMDPQQRVLLEGGYVALHASSFDKATLNGSGTGVALGIYATEFAQLSWTQPSRAQRVRNRQLARHCKRPRVVCARAAGAVRLVRDGVLGVARRGALGGTRAAAR